MNLVMVRTPDSVALTVCKTVWLASVGAVFWTEGQSMPHARLYRWRNELPFSVGKRVPTAHA
jgi:hypothetical protein